MPILTLLPPVLPPAAVLMAVLAPVLAPPAEAQRWATRGITHRSIEAEHNYPTLCDYDTTFTIPGRETNSGPALAVACAALAASDWNCYSGSERRGLQHAAYKGAPWPGMLLVDRGVVLLGRLAAVAPTQNAA